MATKKPPVTKPAPRASAFRRPAIPIIIALCVLGIALVAPLVPKALRYAGITRPTPTQAMTQQILGKAATFAAAIRHLEPGTTPDSTRQKLLARYPAQVFGSRVNADGSVQWDASFTGSQTEGGFAPKQYIAKACVRFTLKNTVVSATPLACKGQTSSGPDAIMLDKKRLEDELKKERPEDSLSKCSVDPSGCGG